VSQLIPREVEAVPIGPEPKNLPDSRRPFRPPDI